MPGTYILKPVEVKLPGDADTLSALNPYCTFVAGTNKAQTQVWDKAGKNPQWAESITMPISDTSDKVEVVLKDQNKGSTEENIGSCTFDLKEVQKAGHLRNWYPLYDHQKYAGEILLEASYQPEELTTGSIGLAQAEITSTVEPTGVFVEQRQVVEPHVFVKQVETVETRSRMKEIEVMEPVKVIKEVPVTEPVHVKKLVEVKKPEVVIKEVEVMEPRLVTKTIQVIEDVPVKRQVEVIEYKTTLEEVDTVEQQTVMKSIEVTEYVPVKKEVQVTEPVTVKKAVEYVEPVITTETVTKANVQPVIVSEEFTQSVGPATLLGMREGNVMESRIIKEEITPIKTVGEDKVYKEISKTSKIIDKATGAETKGTSEKVGMMLDKKTGKTEVVYTEHDF